MTTLRSPLVAGPPGLRLRRIDRAVLDPFVGEPRGTRPPTRPLFPGRGIIVFRGRARRPVIAQRASDFPFGDPQQHDVLPQPVEHCGDFTSAGIGQQIVDMAKFGTQGFQVGLGRSRQKPTGRGRRRGGAAANRTQERRRRGSVRNPSVTGQCPARNGAR